MRNVLDVISAFLFVQSSLQTKLSRQRKDYRELKWTVINALRAELVLMHVNTMLQFHNERYVSAKKKKQLAYYCRGMRGQREIKLKAFAATNINDIKEIVETYF